MNQEIENVIRVWASKNVPTVLDNIPLSDQEDCPFGWVGWWPVLVCTTEQICQELSLAKETTREALINIGNICARTLEQMLKEEVGRQVCFLEDVLEYWVFAVRANGSANDRSDASPIISRWSAEIMATMLKSIDTLVAQHSGEALLIICEPDRKGIASLTTLFLEEMGLKLAYNNSRGLTFVPKWVPFGDSSLFYEYDEDDERLQNVLEMYYSDLEGMLEQRYQGYRFRFVFDESNYGILVSPVSSR